jgi:hypothetical protein
LQIFENIFGRANEPGTIAKQLHASGSVGVINRPRDGHRFTPLLEGMANSDEGTAFRPRFHDDRGLT